MVQEIENNNWQRMEAVIKWANMSVNYFARYIGLSRGENLYQIRRGNNGISKKVARRVVEKFPEVSEMWLLTGSGEMFVSTEKKGDYIPFYRVDVENFITRLDSIKPDEQLMFPSIMPCNLAMLYMGEAMSPRIPVGSIVMLRKTEIVDVIPGADYVVSVGNIVSLRRVRFDGDPQKWRLEACNRERFDDMVVDVANVSGVWKVCSRLITE